MRTAVRTARPARARPHSRPLQLPLLLVLAVTVLAVRQAGAAPAASTAAARPRAAPGNATAAAARVAPYKDHKVVRIYPGTDKQVQALRHFLHANPSLDVWLDPSVPGAPADVRVQPADAASFKEFLSKQSLAHRDMIPDLNGLVEDEFRRMLDDKRASPEFGWDNYHNLEDIYRWMMSLVQKYPGEVTLVDGGRSYEGRTILGVKIKAATENPPIAFMEAGIHAREWITHATATFMINEILTRGDEDFRRVMRAYEWHIFPATNPDGYHYTHSGNRFWRKSMSKYNAVCTGADLNRNWPFHWGEVGTSSSPCSEIYPGVRAESEAETKALKHYLDALLEKPNSVRVYLSVHSYSQLLMYPWAYTQQQDVASHDELDAMALAAVQAASRRYGTQFRHGPIAKTIYEASGSTIDYTYQKGVRFPFVFELRDTGEHGFLLPREQIRPAAEETMDAMVTIAAEALKKK